MAIPVSVRSLSALGAALAVLGCVAKTLSPGAESVRLVHTTPTGCERLADVRGHQGNTLTGDFTPMADLEDGARSDLINHAYKLGANTVQLVDRRGRAGDEWAGNAEPSTVTYSGVAWRCPGASVTRAR